MPVTNGTHYAVNGMQYKISVIMPGLNEEENVSEAVENVVKSFNQLDVSGEIVVINDGSTDRTGEIAEDLIRKYFESLILRSLNVRKLRLG